MENMDSLSQEIKVKIPHLSTQNCFCIMTMHASKPLQFLAKNLIIQLKLQL